MSIADWFASKVARRILRDQTLFSTSSDSTQLAEIFGMQPSAAGVVVTPTLAMQVSAVYACVRIIAGSVASLPLPIFRRNANGDRERVQNDALWWLLNESPNPRWTSASFWEWVVASVLLRRDGFAWIYRDPNGRILELWPLQPDVHVQRIDNRLAYSFSENGQVYGVDQDDMLHFAGLGFDGLRSLSVIEWGARSAAGIAYAADAHSGQFMQSGAASKYVIKAPGTMSQPQRDQLREEFMTRYLGVSGAAKPIVLTQGLDVATISMSAQDAQLIESRRFQVEDIARAFGVPPFMIGATDKTTSWGSGVEHMGRGFLIFTLQPHLVRWEQEMNRKFFRNAGKFVEFNVDGLARADMKTRYDAYRQGMGGSQGPGWLAPNEIRRMENMPPIEGGDALFDPNAAGTQPAPPSTP